MKTPTSPTELIGTYQLTSFEIHKKDGTKAPWSESLHGTLIYSPDGSMSVGMNGDRKTGKGADADLLASILFYCGTYSVGDGQVHHLVTEASDPTRVGKDLVRDARWVATDVLELSGGGDFGRAVLTWKRVKK